MSNRLDKNQLEKMLENLFEQMQKKGVRISDDAKAQIKDNLKDLSSKAYALTPDEAKNPHFQKKLVAYISAFLMGKTKDCDEIFSTLKDENKRCQPDKKLEAKFLLEILTLKILSKLFLEPEMKNNKKLTPEQFSKEMKPHMKHQSDAQKALIQQQLEAALRNLNDGSNPNINGEVQFPILGPVFGNLLAWTNQTIADPNSASKLVESITYNPDKPNDLGLETIAKQFAEMIGGFETPNAVPTNTPRFDMGQNGKS